MTKKHPHDPRESGAALLSVLCLIFTAGLLTAAAMAISKAGSFNVTAHVKLQRSMLVSEGVANRVQWLLAADRHLYSTSEKLGETVYDDYDGDRFLADRVPHVIDYYGEEVQFTISDARSGVDLSSGAYSRSLNSLAQNRDDDADWSDAVTSLRNQIADYIDSNTETTAAPCPASARCSSARSCCTCRRSATSSPPTPPDG